LRRGLYSAADNWRSAARLARVELTRVVSTMRIPPPGMTRVYGAVAFVFVDFRSRINEDSAMNLSGMFSRPLAGRGLS
jgi:hypothetical protein